MTAISQMTVQQVKEKYHLPQDLNAEALQQRAADMVSRGYEWTLFNGHPRNGPAKIYVPPTPCCSLQLSQGRRWSCTVPGWAQSINTSLPLGDPFYGFKWRKDRPDPGHYVTPGETSRWQP